MTRDSIRINHKSDAAYARRLAAKLAFNGWPQFVTITVLLVIGTITCAQFNPIFSFLFYVLGLYVVLSLLLFVYLLIAYTQAVGGYKKGSYTFSFDKKSYSEQTKLGQTTIARSGIKKIRFDKHFVIVYLSLNRRFALPRSQRLVNFLQATYTDKV